MDRITSTSGAPPLIAPRAREYREERKKQDDAHRHTDDENPEEDSRQNPDEKGREDDKKGTHIDIQI